MKVVSLTLMRQCLPLGRANCELEKKIDEMDQTKFKLQKWKFNLEKVTVHLEENQKVLELETESLLAL